MSPIPEPDEQRALAVGREKLRAQPSERARRRLPLPRRLKRLRPASGDGSMEREER